MSKADKLFKDLDYEEYEVVDGLFGKMEIYGVKYQSDEYYIAFSHGSETVIMTVDYTVKLHLAINQKMKELGWIE